MEEGLSIASSIAGIIGGFVGLMVTVRARRREASETEPDAHMPRDELFAFLTHIVAGITLVLAAAAHLFARSAESDTDYELADSFEAMAYFFGWLAVLAGMTAFGMGLRNQRLAGWPFAVFTVCAAGILLMFNYSLAEG